MVANGEGEFLFRDIVKWYLAGGDPELLHQIQGVSFRRTDAIVTTEPRPRIDRLDDIPSPLLTGAFPLLNDRDEFRYDVALLETNRGCPYKCAFCYWGGAIG